MMTMLQVNFKTAKGMFFDRLRITNKADAQTKKALSRFGAFVRQSGPAHVILLEKRAWLGFRGSIPSKMKSSMQPFF
ncbi:MAG: hypothetical protein FWC43_04070, partial [Planctomycetaceae bacterium]|nr:hypothetical protein [Planctomycetaceae bacterium]